MKKKVIFFWLDKTDFFPKTISNYYNEYVKVEQVFRAIPQILKPFRRFFLKINIPFFTKFWLGDWKNEILYYDTVIIHASILTPAVTNYLSKINDKMRIIIWYWNPVEKIVRISCFGKSNGEIWSFDESDCKKFGLKYNTQYYFDKLILNENTVVYDAVFIGSDKGRLEELLEVEACLNKNNLTTLFHITPTKESKNNHSYNYQPMISYEELLELISKTKVIIDYVSSNQSGLTLRPLEALFFKKKLITNDQGIINRNFYKKENIFVYGKDNIADLTSFIECPFEEINEEIINEYNFLSWFKRFSEE